MRLFEWIEQMISMDSPIRLNVLVMVPVTACLVLLVLRAFATSGERKPTRVGIVFEMYANFVRSLIGENVGSEYVKLLTPYYIVLGLFILIANMLGLPFVIKLMEYPVWQSPTAIISVALTLSLMTIFMGHVLAVRKMGGIKYFIKLFNFSSFEKCIMTFVGLLENIINPITLGFRLFINILLGEFLLEITFGFFESGVHLLESGNMVLGPTLMVIVAFVTLAWIGFSVFVGMLQAYIFMMLSSVYLGQTVSEEH